MKFLLDTHIWLWSLLETHRLHCSISEVLENDINKLVRQAASI
jgi:PIN domain nuclease of toxin-antitoxin system